MLSAAHILAMDAKNLLDVVDSIRIRFPQLFSQKPPQTPTSSSSAANTFFNQNTPSTEVPATTTTTKPIQRFMSQTSQELTTSTSSQSSSSPSQSQHLQILGTNEEGYQIMCGDNYENFPQLRNSQFMQQQQQQQQQLQHTTSPPSSLTSTGIYDNECIINQQIKNLDLSDNNCSKPVIASKPSNLQNRLKQSNSFKNSQGIGSLDEPLKIVEDSSQELYSNTSSTSVSSGGPNPGSHFAESNNCSLPQENLFSSQNIMNNKLG